MKNKSLQVIPALLMASLLLSGCEAIGAIFKAGVWTGTIGVIIIILIIIFIAAKLFSRKKNE
jgi:hypothetical protein